MIVGPLIIFISQSELIPPISLIEVCSVPAIVVNVNLRTCLSIVVPTSFAFVSFS